MIDSGILRFWLICGLMMSSLPAGSARVDIDLEEFRWKSRLIVLTASSPEDQIFVEQKTLLASQEEGILERDLRIIEVFQNGQGKIDQEQLSPESVSRLLKSLKVRKEEFRIFLIGKDGTVKLHSDKPVTAAEIFSLIDSMPMRQREMRKNSPLKKF